MDPINYIDPISQIAKGMDIKTTSRSGQPCSVVDIAQSVIDKLVKDKLEWENKIVSVILDTNQSMFDLNASATFASISLPPLYFIAKDEALYFLATGKAPKQPLEEYEPLSGPDDSRLNDKARLQAFGNYIADKLNIPRKEVTWMDRMQLRMYISAIHNQNDKAVNDTLSFIIMHELGHVKEAHSKRTLDYRKRLGQAKYVIINILTLGIFRRAALDLQSRKHEKAADRFGYIGRYAKPEGGIHLFKTVKEFKPKGCKETIAYALFCFSTLDTHGTYGKRKQRIEKHVVKHLPTS